MDIDRVKKFINGDHQNIEGWFFPLDQVAFFELFLAQKQLGITGDVAEVGVFHGKSLALLSLLKDPQENLLGFDLFNEDHQERTESNIEEYGQTSGVELIKGLTTDIARVDLDAMLQSQIRFLHIDAGHEYHEVLEQLLLFTPYVGDQGIIAMDDYQDREFPGIEAAVLDFTEIDRPRRFVPFLAAGNKLFMCPSPMSSTLQKILLRRATFDNSCRLTRVRDFNVLIMRSKLPVSSENILAQINELEFPRRQDGEMSLHNKAARFSQITFGAGEKYSE